jgi:hypothetical protein
MFPPSLLKQLYKNASLGQRNKIKAKGMEQGLH